MNKDYEFYKLAEKHKLKEYFKKLEMNALDRVSDETIMGIWTQLGLDGEPTYDMIDRQFDALAEDIKNLDSYNNCEEYAKGLSYNLAVALFQSGMGYKLDSKRAEQCPDCGSTNTIPIEYGLIVGEKVRLVERGLIKSGGCMYDSEFGEPDCYCKDCGNYWFSKELKREYMYNNIPTFLRDYVPR